MSTVLFTRRKYRTHRHTKKNDPHPYLLVVPLLPKLPLHYYSPPSLGISTQRFTHQSFHDMHMRLGRRGGYIKYSGKYIEIYFKLKITFPIIQLPEYLMSTITHIYQDGGMCKTKQVGNKGKNYTKGGQTEHKLTSGVHAQALSHRNIVVP